MKRGILAFAISVLALLAFGGVTLVSARGADRVDSNISASLNLSPDGCDMNFSDVQLGHTYYQYVLCLYCRGIIGGYSDGTFRPNNDVTRGQLSKIVSESAGFNNNPGSQIFEDVPPGSTYYDYVNRLVQFGYINGYDCGGPGEPCTPQGYRYFRPNAPASRGQIAKIVTQAAGWNDPAGAQSFQDVAPATTFYDYIQRLYAHNAVTGYPCGGPGEPCGGGNLPYFRPTNNVTRGQLTKIDVLAFFPSCVPGNKAD